jgi:tRNA A22 N-methylase
LQVTGPDLIAFSELIVQLAEERMIAENNQHYTIIVAEPGAESYESEEDYKYGRLLLLRSDPVLVRWWKSKVVKLLKNIESIEKSLSSDKSDNAAIKLAELQAEVGTYKDLIQKHKHDSS